MAISTWEPSELDKWKQRAEQAEAELRDLTVEHLGSGPWCEGCGRVTNQVRSSEHPGLCDVCAELERVNRIVVSQSQQLGNTRSQREHELIEALDSTQADADTQFKLRAQAEAELEALRARLEKKAGANVALADQLAALKARRCEGCKRHTRCRMEFENEYPGYSCNHWEAAE